MPTLHVKSSNGTTYAIDLALCKTFIKSGSTAYGGFVPAPSTTAGTTKYLREDCVKMQHGQYQNQQILDTQPLHMLKQQIKQPINTQR